MGQKNVGTTIFGGHKFVGTNICGYRSFVRVSTILGIIKRLGENNFGTKMSVVNFFKRNGMRAPWESEEPLWRMR